MKKTKEPKKTFIVEAKPPTPVPTAPKTPPDPAAPPDPTATGAAPPDPTAGADPAAGGDPSGAGAGEDTTGGAPPMDPSMGGGVEPPQDSIVNPEGPDGDKEEPTAPSPAAVLGGMKMRDQFFRYVKDTAHKDASEATPDDLMEFLSSGGLGGKFEIKDDEPTRSAILGELNFLDPPKTIIQIENAVKEKGQEQFWGSVFDNISNVSSSSATENVTQKTESITARMLAAICERISK